MSRLFSPWTLAVAGALISAGLLTSPNAALWAASLLALPVAVWLLGGTQAYRVLLWLIAVKWLQVIGDVVSADLTGGVISDGWMGPYRVQAIMWSLCAILVLALGMRCGTGLGGWLFRPVVRTGTGSLTGDEGGVSLHRIVPCYFASLVLTQILGSVVFSVPTLAQPVLALALIKFVCVYLLAATVFETEHGYRWLALVSLLEMVTGLVGFFASYKEAFIVMLIALASSRRPVSARMWIFGATAVVLVVWLSLVWTASKKEYRFQVSMSPLEQRLEWVVQRYLFDHIDYGDAANQLFERIGYTGYYAQMLARQDAGLLSSDFNFYASAIEHVLTPRILFPDKPVLDDSKITMAVLGVSIDQDTSIGIGFVAQAQLDFGFPGMFLPILLIGIMTGGAAKYFMTRSAPLLIREAFATATLFLFFALESNIDKSLGGFVTGCLAMGLALKFGYPMIAKWLARSRTLSRARTSIAKIRT
jgi:hypothetical protein